MNEVPPLETTSAPTGEGTLTGSLWDDPLADAAFLKRILNDLEHADQSLAGEYAIVRKTQEALRQAEFQLSRSRACAPIDGAITNLQLAQGMYAKAGTPVISLVAGERWRIVANIPESWLERVRPGDRAEVSLRNYPLRIRPGTVESISRGVMQGHDPMRGTGVWDVCSSPGISDDDRGKSSTSMLVWRPCVGPVARPPAGFA